MRFRVVAVSGKVLFALAFVCAFGTLVAAQSGAPTLTDLPAPVAIGPGDAAISGFSGIGLAGAMLPPGVNPLDKTVITLANPSLKILDLSFIGGAPADQLLPPTVKFAVPAKDIGQVFGLAFDVGGDGTPPNLYAAATSLYGLSIVAEKPGPDGNPVRLKAGAPGARFMEGQFGPGVTPGAIWKIDGTTGKASIFGQTVEGSTPNSGPALGDIAIDPASKSLFASDLDTGLIHRFPLEGGGTKQATFDHGTTGRAAEQLPAVADDKKRAEIASAAFNPGDPTTWGLTQTERRVDGLAVRDSRLYYAVAAGPEIWSVGIAPDGGFAGDARREVEIKAEKPSVVSDIAFDADGRMIAALRGALQGALDYRQFVAPEAGAVLRISPKTGDAKARWTSPPETYAIGTASPTNTATGGVALGYAYGPDGLLDYGKCSATLAATGDALPVAGGSVINGAQLLSADLVQPTKAAEKSAFVDFDVMQNDKALTGHIGDIEIFQPCDGSQFQAVAGDPGTAPDSGAAAAPGGFGAGGGGGPGGFADGGLPGEGVPMEDNCPAGNSAAAAGGSTATEQTVTPIGHSCEISDSGGDRGLKVCHFAFEIDNPSDSRAIKLAPTLSTQPNSLEAITALPDGSPDKKLADKRSADNLLVVSEFSGLVPPKSKSQVVVVATFPPNTTPNPTASLKVIDPLPAAQASVDSDPSDNQSCVTFDTNNPDDPGTPTNEPTLLPRDSGPEACVPPTPTKPLLLSGGLLNTIPKCTQFPGGRKDCEWVFQMTNKSELAKTIFDAKFSIPPSRIRQGSSLERLTFAGVQGAPATDFDMTVSMGSGILSTTIIGEFPPGEPGEADPTLEISMPKSTRDAAKAAGPAPGADVQLDFPEDACVTAENMSPPPGGAPRLDASTPTPRTQGNVIVKKTGVPTCKNSSGCEFTIEVRNDGTEPVNGPITIEERVKVNGAFFDSTKLTVPPADPWKCDPVAEVMACKHPSSIPPKGALFMKLTFAPSSDKELAKTIENCVTAVGLAPPVCATIPVEPDPPPPPPHLVVKKSPLEGAHCPIHGPCVFKIEVTNQGGADYVGPLSVKEFLPGIANSKGEEALAQSMRLVAASDPRWGCDKKSPNEMDCTLAGDIKLARGETTVLLIELVAGHTWKLTNTMTNCAQISYRGAPSQQPLEELNSCANALLDPFNVAVAKTGGQSCQPGKECTFELDIFNPTDNIPHNDPVTVTDKLTGIGNAPILSLTAATGADPFPCNPPPTQAPFTCTGHMHLEPREHNKYAVVIRIPEDAPKSGTFTNCAGVGADAAAAAPGSTDDVCHTTKLEPASPEENCPEGWTGKYPNCTPPQVSGGPNATAQDPVQNALDPSGGSSPTGESACFGGMILVSAGECRCPAPTILNGSTGTCVAAPACPDGYVGEYPYCRLGPSTGGMSATLNSQSVKDRREAGEPRRRREERAPTGGTSSTADSQSVKDRRKAGEPRRRRHREDKPPPTGGMSSTMQVPTGTKLCRGRKVPVSFNCVPKAVGKQTPAQPTGPTGGMNATGQPTPDRQRFKTTTGAQGAASRPDKRIQYGSSANDIKPAGKPLRAIGKCRSGTSYNVVQKRCTPNVNVR